jgi:hypothetical protein
MAEGSKGERSHRIPSALPQAVVPMISARSPVELETVVDHVHDHWLDLNAIQFTNRTLRIPVTDRVCSRVNEQTTFPWSLLIQSVEEWSFEDRAKIGFYDITDLAYDSAQRTIQVMCGFPLVISARVRELDISLENPGALSSK